MKKEYRIINNLMDDLTNGKYLYDNPPIKQGKEKHKFTYDDIVYDRALYIDDIPLEIVGYYIEHGYVYYYCKDKKNNVVISRQKDLVLVN